MSLRWLKRYTTIFYKLFLFYILLTLIVTLVASGLSYAYYSYNFKQTAINTNQIALDYIERHIKTNLINETEKLFYAIISKSDKGLSGIDILNVAPDDYFQINAIYNYLNERTALSSDLINAIHIYYPNTRMLLSSSRGVKRLDDYPNYSDDMENLIKQLDRSAANFTLIKTRNTSSNYQEYENYASPSATYFRAYPSTQAAKLYLAIDVKESALKRMITRNDPYEREVIMLASRDGDIIAVNDSAEASESARKEWYVDLIPREDENSRGSRETSADGIRLMLTYRKIDLTSWYIISTIPMEVFNRLSIDWLKTIALICLFSILIGVVCSRIFTTRLYSPIRTLLGNAGKWNDSNRPKDEVQNEYYFINSAMDTLSSKVIQLENTISKNGPLIKYNLLLGLLSGTVNDIKKIEEMQRLIGINLLDRSLRVMLIEINPTYISDVSAEYSQFLLYSVIERIEGMSGDELSAYAIEVSNTKIASIICSSTDVEEEIRCAAAEIRTFIKKEFDIYLSIILGRGMEDILRVHDSYENCAQMLKYSYLYPKEPLLSVKRLIEREKGEVQIPDTLLSSFEHSLSVGDYDNVTVEIHSIINSLIEREFSYFDCNRVLISIVNILRKYVSDNNADINNIVEENAISRFRQIKDIYEFEEWILAVTKEVVEYIGYKETSMGTDIIDRVRKYCMDNIGGDLSLDTVSSMVFISPGYLSRLFKKEQSVSYSVFVNEIRIKEAKRLLVTTDYTIESIVTAVGFNTPHYFSKRFKETYGMTPKEYRIRFTEKAEGDNV